MNKWISPAIKLPEDEQEVWTRIKYFYGPPFISVYNESEQIFESNESGLRIPAYMVARWKEV